MQSFPGIGLLFSCAGSVVSKNPGDGGGASVCLRRLLDTGIRPNTLEGILVEMLLRGSDPVRLFLEEPGLINLDNWLSFPGPLPFLFGPELEILEVLEGFALWSNDFRDGEGVNGGPCSGAGRRWKASWELTSRTIASCSVSNVGCGLKAWVVV